MTDIIAWKIHRHPNQLTEALTLLALLALIAMIWVTSMRARETATVHCRRACRAQEVQMLDATVALSAIGLCHSAHGLRLRRTYQFTYSRDGVERVNGLIILVGNHVEAIYFAPLSA